MLDLQERAVTCTDDLLIFGAHMYEHMSNLKDVFKRLQQSDLKIQPDKWEFLRKEVAYLDHLITKGVQSNPSKTGKVENFPQPKNPTEIKSFLGFIGYYRKFISKVWYMPTVNATFQRCVDYYYKIKIK